MNRFLCRLRTIAGPLLLVDQAKQLDLERGRGNAPVSCTPSIFGKYLTEDRYRVPARSFERIHSSASARRRSSSVRTDVESIHTQDVYACNFLLRPAEQEDVRCRFETRKDHLTAGAKLPSSTKIRRIRSKIGKGKVVERYGGSMARAEAAISGRVTRSIYVFRYDPITAFLLK